MLKKLLASGVLVLSFGSYAPAQTIENASRSTIGYISSNGTVENASRATIGYVNSDGSVENSSRGAIGYFKGVDPKHVAAFFFFFFNPKD